MVLYNAKEVLPINVDNNYDVYDFDRAYEVMVILKDGTIDFDKYISYGDEYTWYINGDDVMYWTFKKIDVNDNKINKVDFI